jgi:hypothetical protein
VVEGSPPELAGLLPANVGVDAARAATSKRVVLAGHVPDSARASINVLVPITDPNFLSRAGLTVAIQDLRPELRSGII